MTIGKASPDEIAAIITKKEEKDVRREVFALTYDIDALIKKSYEGGKSENIILYLSSCPSEKALEKIKKNYEEAGWSFNFKGIKDMFYGHVFGYEILLT